MRKVASAFVVIMSATVSITPVLATPTQGHPPKQVPAPQPPTQQVPGQRPPTQQEPGQRPPTQQEPGQRPPTQQEPGQRPPTQQEPGQRPPTQQEPGQRPPTQQVPGQRPPTQQEPGQRPGGHGDTSRSDRFQQARFNRSQVIRASRQLTDAASEFYALARVNRLDSYEIELSYEFSRAARHFNRIALQSGYNYWRLVQEFERVEELFLELQATLGHGDVGAGPLRGWFEMEAAMDDLDWAMGRGISRR